jgi:hypothetical protein
VQNNVVIARREATWQSDLKGRCEGEARGNLKEIPRSARNDTSCQIASLRSQ